MTDIASSSDAPCRSLFQSALLSGGLLLAVLCFLFAPACGDRADEDPGRLVVALTSDMQVPKDISRVTVVVRRGSEPEAGKALYNLELQGEELSLPATLPVKVGQGEPVDVAVRVSAWQGSGDDAILRVVADRTTTVPADGRVVLEVPLQWLCDGFGGGLTGGVSTACPSGQTCIGGACEGNWVDPASLPPYQEGTFEASGCFDAVACFESTELVESLDLESCSLKSPASVEVGINVALALESGDGACTSEQCWIVLDGFSESGWSKQGERLLLPPSACDRIASGQVRGVAVITRCPTKTWSLPLCPYRTDGSSGMPTQDAGVVSCSDTQHECAGACVANSSPAACGTSCEACRVPANGRATCDGSQCGVRCDAGYHPCRDVCVSDASVASCGDSCAECPEPNNGTARCTAEGCHVVCATGYHLCSDKCVHDSSTAACGEDCEPCAAPNNATPSCDGTSCDFRCNGGYHRCGDTCVNDKSTDSCGDSCSPCPVPANSRATCDGASCDFACLSGYHRCGAKCKSDHSVQSCGSSCSACPDPANGDPICNGTRCSVDCDPGYHRCGSECKSNRSVDSCGSSCTACSDPAHGDPSCDGTSCDVECHAGYGKCGMQCRNDTCSSTEHGSCLEILDSGDSEGDGHYFIDPDGDGTGYLVWCDMTTEGGGWTRVVNWDREAAPGMHTLQSFQSSMVEEAMTMQVLKDETDHLYWQDAPSNGTATADVLSYRADVEVAATEIRLDLKFVGDSMDQSGTWFYADGASGRKNLACAEDVQENAYTNAELSMIPYACGVNSTDYTFDNVYKATFAGGLNSVTMRSLMYDAGADHSRLYRYLIYVR